jgi:hypothetical protein
MKIKHIKESNFEEVEFEYPDFQIELTQAIAKFLKTPFPYIPSDDGKKTYLLVQDERCQATRSEREIGVGKYRITIEPLEKLSK